MGPSVTSRETETMLMKLRLLRSGWKSSGENGKNLIEDSMNTGKNNSRRLGNVNVYELLVVGGYRVNLIKDKTLRESCTLSTLEAFQVLYLWVWNTLTLSNDLLLK